MAGIFLNMYSKQHPLSFAELELKLLKYTQHLLRYNRKYVKQSYTTEV